MLQVKFRFTSCLIKGNALISGRRSSLSSQLIVLLFLRNSHLQRDILANIFSPVFSWTLRKFLQRIKKMFQKFLESSQKKKTVAKLCFNKVAGFYRSCHRRCFVKEVFLEISQNSQENTCARDSILITFQLF